MVLAPAPGVGRRPSGAGRPQDRRKRPGAVMLAATFKTPGGDRCSLAVSAHGGATDAWKSGRAKASIGCCVRCPARYAVVPDFFGDDMVFPAAAIAGPGFACRPRTSCWACWAPAQRSELMCVWQSPGSRRPPFDPAWEASCGAKGGPRDADWTTPVRRVSRRLGDPGRQGQEHLGRRAWRASVSGTQQVLATEDAAGAIALDWKPPFAAKWRADLLRVDGAATVLVLPRPGRRRNARPRPADPLGDGPCCFEAGRAWCGCPRVAVARRAVPRCWSTPWTAAARRRLRPIARSTCCETRWASAPASTSSRPRGWPRTRTPRPTT